MAPDAKRDARIFEDRPDAYRELFLAALAAPQESLAALSGTILHLKHAGVTAARASRTAVPAKPFNELDRRSLGATSLWKVLQNL